MVLISNETNQSIEQRIDALMAALDITGAFELVRQIDEAK